MNKANIFSLDLKINSRAEDIYCEKLPGRKINFGIINN